MIRGPKKSVSVLLPLELYETLRTLSQESSRTIPAYIRQILKRYVRHLDECPGGPDDWWVIR